MTVVGDRLYYLLVILATTECVCGAEKTYSTAFCDRCYSNLPANLQRGLERRVGWGFGKAYEKALKFLKKQGAI